MTNYIFEFIRYIMSNLFKRVISAAILIPTVIYILYIGELVFFGFSFLIYLGLLYEWAKTTSKKRISVVWLAFGFIYISIAMFTMILLERYRDIEQQGEYITQTMPWALLIILLIVWFTDSFAYLFGKLIGGPKIAPKISPNKTWAGFAGGLLGASILFAIFYFSSERIANSWQWLLPTFLVLSVISVIGDFFESWVKRKFGVKDSGNIIPGHGGLLDRLDGLIMVLNVIGISGSVFLFIKTGFNF